MKKRCNSESTERLSKLIHVLPMWHNALEMLEPRWLLSAFFDYNIVADSSGAFTGFGTGPSINDDGTVAFVGKHTVGDSLFVSAEGGATTNISPSFDNTSARTFKDTVQINNAGQVVVQARDVGATLKSFLLVFNSAATDSYSQLASGDSGGNGDFDAVLPYPSVNDAGATAFASLSGVVQSLTTPSTFSFNTQPMKGIQPMIANNGKIIVRAGNTATSPINLYSSSLSLVQTIADSSMGFTTLGQAPGISDDGKVVVWAGDRGNGPGIFARFDDGSGTFGAIQRIAGENAGTGGTNPELGFDASGGNLYFSSFSIDSRVGVAHKDFGLAGLVGDTVEVAFIGTPNAASVTNNKTSSPLLFSNQLGLWSQRIEMENKLTGTATFVAHPDSALPVVQVGDMLGGSVVTGVTINDPIALANKDDTGVNRTDRPGDHRLTFVATTAAGAEVVRASHLDSDEDGLLDHWEKPGGGIDMNGDGTIDLDLHALGADPMKRDLFLEVDWLTPRVGTGGLPSWSNEPPPGTIHQLVVMFQNAPALADGVPAGITLHVDGGSGKDVGGNPFSVNMGTGALTGGDKVTMPDGVTHPDLVYLGLPGSISVPGLNARSFTDIKNNYFGNNSNNARELAFHYTVLSDYNDIVMGTNKAPVVGNVTGFDNSSLHTSTAFPNSGDIILITQGAGAGQLRQISGKATDGATGDTIFDVSKAWTTHPDATSKFVKLISYSGVAEVGFYPGPDNNSVAGSDFIVSMGAWGGSSPILSNTFYMWRTLAHELGHTLGLRHGGVDHEAFKGTAFKSLMSYSYQLEDTLAPSNQVYSYAGISDPTFNDWANLKLDFQDAFVHLGNAYNKDANGASADPPGETELDYPTALAQHNGPFDVTGPDLVITSPAANTVVPIGDGFTVTFTANDASGLGTVQAAFDINGDGNTDGTGETVAATLTGPNAYSATFANVTGTPGNRNANLFVNDTLGNVSLSAVRIHAGTTIGNPPIVGDDSAHVRFDAPTVLNVLANDTTDSAFNLASVTVAAAPIHGTTSINPDGTITYNPNGSYLGADSFTYIVTDTNDNVSDVATVNLTVGVRIGTGASKSVTFADADQTLVTVTLSKGVADVLFSGDAIPSVSHGKVLVTGSNLAIAGIAATGTTKASALKIITNKAGDGTTTVGSISADAALGSIIGTGTTLTGALQVGGLSSLRLNSLSGATVTIGNAGAAAVSIMAGAIADSTISSLIRISSLKIASWTASQANASSLSAPILSSGSIKGDFQPNVTLTDPGKSLGSMKVGGQLGMGTWTIAGSVASVSAATVAGDWSPAITGALGSFKVISGGLSANLVAGSLGTLTVIGDLTGDLTGSSLKVLKVAGAITDASLLFGDSIGSITTTGAWSNVYIHTGANIRSISALSMDGSRILAGVDPSVTLVSALANNIGSATISSVALKARTGFAFSNSSILAGTIKVASLKNVNTSNGAVPFGLAATTLRSVSGVFGDVKLGLSSRQLKDQSTLDAYVALKNVSFGDFVIKVIDPQLVA